MEDLIENTSYHSFINYYTQCKIHDNILAIEVLEGHSMSPHYKVICQKAIYTFRFVANYDSNNSFRILESIYKDLKCIKRIIDIVDTKNGKHCIVSEWIYGMTASNYLSAFPNRKKHLAESVAETIWILHHQNISGLQCTKGNIDRFISDIGEFSERLNISIPHLSTYLEILQNHSCLKPKHIGICHLDLHLNNIVIDPGDTVYLIDLENISVTDTWRDFLFATTFFESDLEKALWKNVLRLYFQNDIPSEFWLRNFIYGIIKMLHMCMFEINKGNRVFAAKISDDFYRIYDGLSTMIPIYFRERDS